MDPSAPETQNAIAEVYDLLVRQTKVGDERRDYERKVLEARTALAEVHRRHAVGRREQGQPGGAAARRGARAHGPQGRGHHAHAQRAGGASTQAAQTSDPKEQLRLTNYALQEYKLAGHRLARVPEAGRERARTRTRAGTSTPTLSTTACASRSSCTSSTPRQYPEPSSQEIATGDQGGGRRARLGRGRPVHRQRGLFVVDLADVDRDLAFQRWKDSSGAQGIEPRKEPKLEGTEGVKKVVVDDIPDVIQKSMQARDEYVQRVPAERDKQGRAADYAFYAADQYYLYGHFKEAQQRFQAMYEQYCRKKPIGYEAWKRLLDMAPQEQRRRAGGGARRRPIRTPPRRAPSQARRRRGDRREQGAGLHEERPRQRALQGRERGLRGGEGRAPGPAEGRPLAQGGQDVRGRAARRAVAQGRARRRDQLGVLLQAGRRVQQGHRPLPALHQQLRERGHPRPPRARRASIPRRSRRPARISSSTRSASSTSGWRTTPSRRRTTASSPTSARPSRSGRSRRTRGSTTRGGRTPRASAWCSTRTSATAAT